MATKKEIYFGQFEVTDQVFYTTPLCFALVNIKPLLPGHVLVIPHRKVDRFIELSSAETTDIFTTVQKVQHMLSTFYFQQSTHPSSAISSTSTISSTVPSSTPDTTSANEPDQQQNTTPNPDQTSDAAQRSPPTSLTSPSPAPAAIASTLHGSFNLAIQDGADAGQSVAHLHVHVIPRPRGNTTGDAVYDAMNSEAGNVGGQLWDRAHARDREGGGSRGRGDETTKDETTKDAMCDGRERPIERDEHGRPVVGGQFPKVDDEARRPRSKEVMNEEAARFRARMGQLGYS